jgi:ribosomal protein S12 methylthiotransferase
MTTKTQNGCGERLKVAMVSLGCSRTLVDSEVALGGLQKDGYTVVEGLEDADIAIVNTCGFIEEAKLESVETILELCEMKKKGDLKAVVVLGCLAQQYPKELLKELGDVDGIIGTNNYGDLAKILKPIKEERKRILEVTPRPHFLLNEDSPRYRLTAPHTAYVKISEGCINACSYCVIPKMKGPHRSRTIESILTEIKNLCSERPLSEINLVGQDTAAFGFDRNKAFELPALLREIDGLKLVPWVRLLYAHPGHVTEELVDALAECESLCKYVDFPIEHSHNAMLQRMNRGVTREKMEWGIQTLRKKIPSAQIRTTVIVGFPGETDEEFEDLMDFLKEVRFEKLGAFKFSREENARAYDYPNQIPDAVKEQRFQAVMSLQREISRDIQESFIGRDLKVLIDENDPSDPTLFYGRTQADAPEVDGQVNVRSSGTLKPGEFVSVNITDALEYDLVGNVAS